MLARAFYLFNSNSLSFSERSNVFNLHGTLKKKTKSFCLKLTLQRAERYYEKPSRNLEQASA